MGTVLKGGGGVNQPTKYSLEEQADIVECAAEFHDQLKDIFVGEPPLELQTSGSEVVEILHQAAASLRTMSKMQSAIKLN